MGATLIGLELLLLLAFQAIYGYVYQQLAIIIGGFMVGMALGSWWGLRREAAAETDGQEQADIFRLAWLQFAAASSPMLLYLLLKALEASSQLPTIFVVSQIVFPLLALFCGLLGGYQFPIASRLFFATQKGAEGSPGTFYALDLAGSCLGALVLSSYLIPAFGFQQTAWLMAVVNLAPGILVCLLAFEKKAGQAREARASCAH
jgi:spermidine synthase